MSAALELIDSHSHIDVDSYSDDRDATITRARAAGVTDQIVPAIEAATWKQLAEICDSHLGLHPAFGLHPMYLSSHTDAHLLQLREWLARPGCVAVGECGLDHFVDGLDPVRQLELLDAQLRLAREFELPVILHARRAVDPIFAALRRHGIRRGVVHSFSGSRQQADHLIQQGLHLGIGGPVTYERAQRLRQLVAELPLEHLLLETDSPDQPDSAHRGERNEPARLREVLRCVAELRGIEESEVASVTTANARALFGLA